MKGKRKLPKILEIDEEQQLLDWTRQNRNCRDYVVILTILRTGLRTNELRELLISDVSTDGKILTHLKERKISIPNDLREQLLAFLEWKEQHGESIEPMSFLFASAKSPQVTVRHLQRIIRESTLRALGKAYRVHDLRRTFECRLLNDDRKTIPNLSPVSTDEIAEDAETTFSSLAPPIHPIDGEYIREWLVLGPFFPDDLEKDFLAGVGGETNIHPQEGDTVTTEDGRELTWQRYQTKGDIISLLDFVGEYKSTTAYAFCVLQSEAAGDAQIYLGSGCGVTVWINDKQVHSHPVGGYSILDKDVFEAHLKAGANRCLIKLSQGFTSLEFAVRMTTLHPNRSVISGTITDEKGKPIPNADVRLEQQDDSEIAQTTTDASGSYRLNIHPVSGQYALSAISGDLGDWRLGIQLDEGEHRTQNLTLKEAISIEGTLLMLDDTTPHVAVPVQAICNEKVIATTLSDESGKYRFINLKPGQYQLRCQVLGGYVYYGSSTNNNGRENGRMDEWKDGREQPSNHPTIQPSSPQVEIEEEVREILQVEEDKTLKGINFRFAPFKKGTWRNYNTLDGLGYSVVRAIYRDADGVMWFGTEGGGISQYDGKTFVNLTMKDGLVHNTVLDIYRDPDGVMWFATHGGVSRYDFDGKTFINLTTKDGLVNDDINAIYGTPDGMMWFATCGGISKYDGKTFVNFTTKDGLAGNFVTAIYRDPAGVMWFATHDGVSQYDGKTFINLTTKDGLVNNSVNAIYGTPDGTMWFATCGGISKYDGKTFVNFTLSLATSATDGLANNWVNAIYRDPAGVMWFATGHLQTFERGGVSQYDGETFINFTTKDGLVHNTVCDIDCFVGCDAGFDGFDTPLALNPASRDRQHRRCNVVCNKGWCFSV